MQGHTKLKCLECMCWWLQGGKGVWQVLLDDAVSQEADALMDCGALLCGVSNRYGRSTI